jgi:threonine dehydratase
MITIIIAGHNRAVTGSQAMSSAMGTPVTIGDVEAAAAALGDAVARTPTSPARTLSEITGADVWLKFENLQFTGSFKERGARNFLLDLAPDARARGVVTASAGNHAQGVAYHTHLLGIAATIVMPADTPFTKVSNTEHHGARVVLHGDDYAAASVEAHRLAREQGATFVPPFDDPLVIAGQGTVALELLDDMPRPDIVVVPVGGGGLIAGVAVAVKARDASVQVVGVQSDAFAGMMHALGRADAPPGGDTIAEGIAVIEPGAITRTIVRDLVDDLVVVPEARIEEAIGLGIEIEKTVLEGAGAAGLAALLEHPGRFEGQRVAVVLSGGNIDARVLTSVLLRALARSGRLIRLRIEVPDRPGVLASVARIIASQRGNVIDVEHRRDLPGVALRHAMLDVSVETRNRAHADAIVADLVAAGLRVEGP